MLPTGNLYPNNENRPKRVENHGAAGWKSLPKQREIAEKGRESQCCRLEISTQKAKNLAERVENPTAAARKSLPKQRKTTEKGRNFPPVQHSRPRRLNPTNPAGSTPMAPSAHTPAPPAHIFSIVSSHILLQASLGMRRSPLGEMATEPTLGPSGRQERLNCWLKKRR